ncbi:uncharacterized protein [Littorina saxatilis]|uniref:FZ domain-containing protein n=1 Tax=Littorina saxatilis TaxID=31220 RepID=A0AAN9FZP2_9CAEN
MVSTKVLLVAVVVVCVLVETLSAQRSQPNPNRRNRGRNRAGNRTRTAGNRNAGNRNRNASNRNAGNRRRCEEIEVPMCKGLVGYTHTKLPNRFNHTTQLQVYRVLEHLWAMIDRGCSQNFRLLACSLYLPRCAGRGAARGPCRKTCKVTRRVCQASLQQFGYTWPEEFDCNALPKKRCLKQGRHNSCSMDHTQCVDIDLPMCTDLSFRIGMSPNMFGQCNRTEIAMEMEQFRPLVESQCSPKLGLFLCGVYMPWCASREGGLTFPCQEVCSEVREACEPTYRRLTRGLPWPNKLQCHRYPASSNANYTCVMEDDVGAINLP